MHPYATESAERRRVYAGLASFSVLAALGMTKLLMRLNVQAPWWLDTPSVVGFFGLGYALFDRVLWRVRIRGFGLSALPVLDGSWAATITSSFDQHRQAHHCRAEIRQSWTHILITLETEASTSRSVAACVSMSAEFPIISYQYQNTPRSSAVSTMEQHRGAAEMLVRSPERLEVEYFSGRGRSNHGTILLSRMPAGVTAPLTSRKCP